MKAEDRGRIRQQEVGGKQLPSPLLFTSSISFLLPPPSLCIAVTTKTRCSVPPLAAFQYKYVQFGACGCVCGRVWDDNQCANARAACWVSVYPFVPTQPRCKKNETEAARLSRAHPANTSTKSPTQDST